MREGFYDHTENGYIILSAALNAGGEGQGFLGPVPAGYCWYVERWTQRSAHTAVLELAVVSSNRVPASADWDRAGRVDFAATALNAVGPNGVNPIFVDEGDYLVALFTGGTAADICLVSLQVAVHRKAYLDYSEGSDIRAQQPRLETKAGVPPAPDPDNAAVLHDEEPAQDGAAIAAAASTIDGLRDSGTAL